MTTTTPTPLTGDLSTGQLKARELSIPCNEVRHADAGIWGVTILPRPFH